MKKVIRICCLITLLQIFLSSCRIYVYPLNDSAIELKRLEQDTFNNHVKVLNRQLIDQTPTCNFDLILEMIAKSQSRFKTIHISHEAGDEILKFLNEGYHKLGSTKISFENADEMERHLHRFISQVFSEAVTQQKPIDGDFFTKMRETLCPWYPFC